MISQEKEVFLETSEGIEEVEYVIKADKEAFRTLAKTIYSHPIKTPIRELCTNAFDAHVAAGKKDEPFEVHLPNLLEPYFSVKDNGTGLSDEQIRGVIVEFTDNYGNVHKKRKNGIYTTFFDSNKTESNEFTGCLGLGSKSPFGYTDQFSIESRYNGVKTIYNSFINKMGRPAIAKLGETPTDEPNGIEIKFSVKSSDYNAFCAETSNILQWFAVRPKVVGNPSFKYPEQNFFLEEEKYCIYKNNVGLSKLLMGNVLYALPSTYSLGYSSNLCTVLNHGVIIKVPIGSVNIAANREAVICDDVLKNCVKPILEEIVAKCVTLVGEELKKCTNEWEANKTITDNKHVLIHKFGTTSKYANKIVDGYLSFNTNAVEIIRIYKRTYQNKKRMQKVDRLPVSSKLVYIFNDLSKGGIIRARQYMDTNNVSEIYLVKAIDKTGAGDKALTDCGFRSDPNVKLTSSLPKPIYAKRTYIKGESGTIYELLYNNRTSKEAWKAVELDDVIKNNKEIVYVIIDRFMIKNTGFSSPSDKIYTKINKVLNINIYGLRQRDFDKLTKSKIKFITLQEYIKRYVEKNDIKNIVNLAYSYRSYDYAHLYNGYSSYSEFEKLHKNSPFRLFAEECKKHMLDDATYANYKDLLAYLAIYPVNLNKISGNTVEKNYPLLPNIRYEPGHLIIEYVHMIDTYVLKL